MVGSSEAWRREPANPWGPPPPVTPNGRKQVIIETKGMTVDLSEAEWHKSTRSGPNCDNCVEVAFVGGAVALRDSKNPTGPALIFTEAEWLAFTLGAKDGEFDL